MQAPEPVQLYLLSQIARLHHLFIIGAEPHTY